MFLHIIARSVQILPSIKTVSTQKHTKQTTGGFIFNLLLLINTSQYEEKNDALMKKAIRLALFFIFPFFFCEKTTKGDFV